MSSTNLLVSEGGGNGVTEESERVSDQAAAAAAACAGCTFFCDRFPRPQNRKEVTFQ